MKDEIYQFLPQPFAWITIPAGKVTVISIISNEGRENYIPQGTSQIFEVAQFEIAKYPLTNAQYAKFIQANGYSQRQWWSAEGWSEKEKNAWTEPLYWHDTKWNKPDHPIVGVSWYEAIAYCQWISEVIGETISLPTEQQWQRAAQGDTDWYYAWGPRFEEGFCNWDTEGTSAVTQFEGKGDSIFGVVDMNGNVWEWCLTNYRTGENTLKGSESHIARGGAWAMLYSHELTMTTIDRLGLSPSKRRNDIGFRLICS
jgi:formylglycine-generating enzyme required for sulfatase activity